MVAVHLPVIFDIQLNTSNLYPVEFSEIVFRVQNRKVRARENVGRVCDLS